MSELLLHNFQRWLQGKASATLLMMADGINADAAAIHRAFPNVPWVAGYVDGLYKWSDADWALFPKAHKVYIAVRADTNDGDVLDCERGDATPEQCPGWIKLRKAAGYFMPTIYCNASTFPAVRVACAAAGLVQGKDYDVWIADWTGVPHEIDGASAVQYRSASFLDYSAVYDTSWPHRKAPAPKPVVVTYLKRVAPGGKTLAELAALDGVDQANAAAASKLKLSAGANAQLENVVQGHLLRGMVYFVSKES